MHTNSTVSAPYRATLHTTVLSPAAPLPATNTTHRAVRHNVSPQAGHALEILGHAIEYLADEYVHERGFLNADDERMETVQLLVKLNRQVYSECPVLPSIGDRCLSILHRVFHHNQPHLPLT